MGAISTYLGNLGSFRPSPDPQSASPPIYHTPASVPAKRASSDSLSETSRAGLSSRMSSSSDSTGLGYGVAKGPRVCGRPGSPLHHSLILPPHTHTPLQPLLSSCTVWTLALVISIHREVKAFAQNYTLRRWHGSRNYLRRASLYPPPRYSPEVHFRELHKKYEVGSLPPSNSCPSPG